MVCSATADAALQDDGHCTARAGGRTLREFANMSGLSEGFLSRLTTGKLESAPTRRSLTKLTADTSKPQNGITLGMMMAAAGYPYTEPEPQVNRRLAPSDRDAVPAVVQTAAFAAFLTASTLEASGRLGQRYSSDNQREMFVITSKSDKAPRDFLTKRPDKNASYESKYLVDDHEAVVSREVWDAVQLRLGQHQEEVMSGGYYDGRSHFLHGRVFRWGFRTLRTSRLAASAGKS